ncbi:MAG: TCP-1/cpn60 chaperonin family protein, partial [Candidatus Saccharimonadales bacterium]
LLAHGFSDLVLGDLHANWNFPKSLIKVFPLTTPRSAILNWGSQFLHDMEAYTGSTVFNPIDRPLANMDCEKLINSSRVKFFEGNRFRSSVVANEDDTAIEMRVDELKLQKLKPESEYEANDLAVRIGKLTSGIARLVIYGPSQGETRERRDRAEDAWMAIRGAIKHGACPGGGFVLTKLSADLTVAANKIHTMTPRKMALIILAEAFLQPVRLLYKNYGHTDAYVDAQMVNLLKNEDQTFDISEQKWVAKDDILDSVSAVTEAIANSISIASLLGTLGGIVAFKRDAASDKEEERMVRNFEAGTGDR